MLGAMGQGPSSIVWTITWDLCARSGRGQGRVACRIRNLRGPVNGGLPLGPYHSLALVPTPPPTPPSPLSSCPLSLVPPPAQLCERGYSLEQDVCSPCLTGTVGRLTTFGIVIVTVGLAAAIVLSLLYFLKVRALQVLPSFVPLSLRPSLRPSLPSPDLSTFPSSPSPSLRPTTLHSLTLCYWTVICTARFTCRAPAPFPCTVMMHPTPCYSPCDWTAAVVVSRDTGPCHCGCQHPPGVLWRHQAEDRNCILPGWQWAGRAWRQH